MGFNLTFKGLNVMTLTDGKFE